MSKTRIVTCTDHVDAPTGFGRQHNMLCKQLADSDTHQARDRATAVCQLGLQIRLLRHHPVRGLQKRFTIVRE